MAKVEVTLFFNIEQKENIWFTFFVCVDIMLNHFGFDTVYLRLSTQPTNIDKKQHIAHTKNATEAKRKTDT